MEREKDASKLHIPTTTPYTEKIREQEQKNMMEVMTTPMQEENSSPHYYNSAIEGEGNALARAAKNLKAVLMKSMEVNVHQQSLGYTEEISSYVGTGILLAGETAANVLECTMNDIKKEKSDVPAMITLTGQIVNSLTGIGLQTFVNSAILDANKIFSVFILVLENFKQEQITDICCRNFIKKTLYDQPRLADIIFVTPFIENLKIFSTTFETIILTSEFRCDQNYINSSTCSTTTQTVEKLNPNNLEIEKKIPPLTLTVKSQPSSFNSLDKVAASKLEVNASRNGEEISQEIKGNESYIPHVTTFYDLKAALKNQKTIEFSNPESEKMENKNETCMGRFCSFLYSGLTQCGDCCFY